ncbi:uncharacterized protein TNCV_3365941 [Trichonephila clavipes]|nr:uncharacterized protein TNCV_3365941 [Trichonephila clavipes]
MALHTITPAGVVCHCKVKTELRNSLRNLHIRTRLSSLFKLNLDSSLIYITTCFYSVAIPSRRALHQPKRRHRWVGVIGSTHNGYRDTRCPAARSLTMVRKDTEARSEGATCVWTVVNEAVGSMRAYCIM